MPTNTPNAPLLALSEIAGLPRLDAAAIAQLRELAPVGADQTPVLEILELFFSTTPERFALVDRALENGDAGALGQQAHALKSAAAAVGSCRLSKIFLAIEKTAAGDPGELRGLVAAAHAEYEATRAELLREFSPRP